ncbi:hypothetical protein [Pseudomonas lactis]|uniref:hypothetical protein n=1 Tax=Pseudomonas lactis TaxID=1615674 RepID=UPI003F800C08
MGKNTPPSTTDLLDLKTRGIQAITLAIDTAETIDRLLVQIGELFYSLQPMRDGRIAIEFAKDHGKVRPIVKVYRKLRTTAWVSDNVSHVGLTRRVKKAREFSANYKVMVDLCSRVTALIDLRTAMLDRVRHLCTGVNNSVAARSDFIIENQILIGGMLERLKQQLEEAATNDN